MSNSLRGVRVAFVVANEGIEQAELLAPWRAVLDAGGTPELIAPRPGLAGTMRHLDKGDRFPVDLSTAQARAEEFDAVVLPGGVASPDLLRQDTPAVNFLIAMVGSGKPVAAIGHGPCTLIEGGLVAGRTVTSSPSLQTDLRNAGAVWVDDALHICRDGVSDGDGDGESDGDRDGVMITGRRPEDLPSFCRAITSVFAETLLAVTKT